MLRMFPHPSTSVLPRRTYPALFVACCQSVGFNNEDAFGAPLGVGFQRSHDKPRPQSRMPTTSACPSLLHSRTRTLFHLAARLYACENAWRCAMGAPLEAAFSVVGGRYLLVWVRALSSTPELFSKYHVHLQAHIDQARHVASRSLLLLLPSRVSSPRKTHTGDAVASM